MRLTHWAAVVPVLLVMGAVAHCTVQPIVPPPRAPGVAVDPAGLEARVRWLASAPRSHRDIARLDVIATELTHELEAAGATSVEPQVFVPASGGGSYRNVVAHFGPDTLERVVVGAHYDAHGTHPGADDNASGVAGLLALAPLLARSSLGVHVELVAYTLEEPPHFATGDMGSVRHAALIAQRGQRVRAMLSLEMIGYLFASRPVDRQSFVVDRHVGRHGLTSPTRQVASAFRARRSASSTRRAATSSRS